MTGHPVSPPLVGLAALALLLTASVPALANDTMAQAQTGGIGQAPLATLSPPSSLPAVAQESLRSEHIENAARYAAPRPSEASRKFNISRPVARGPNLILGIGF